MITFGLIWTTFESRIIFGGSWAAGAVLNIGSSLILNHIGKFSVPKSVKRSVDF